MPKKKKLDKKSILDLDFTSAFDEVDKICKLQAGNRKLGEPLSTGILDLDLKIGGGLRPSAWYEFYGAESSGKTTALYHCLGSALNIPTKNKGIFINAEGTIDAIWFKNITGFHPDIVFGKQDNEGNWIIKPQIRHYKPTIGERALELLKKSLRKLPDKEVLDNNWYYVFKYSDAKNIKKSGGYTKQQVQSIAKQFGYDKKLYDKTGDIYVPVPNNYSGVEFIIGVDSWPTLVPEAVSDDDSKAMAQKARMYATYVDDIKSLVINKGAVLIGINQIRLKPGVIYGNPEDVPCGSALKHAADCKTRFAAISSQGTNKGQVEEDGDNRYRWFNYKTTKNKLFIPFHSGINRWCVQRGLEVGNGCDIVEDVKQYLTATNQLTVARGKFKIKISGKKEKVFTLKEFIKNIYKLKEVCLKQLKTKKAVNLYLKGIDNGESEKA